MTFDNSTVCIRECTPLMSIHESSTDAGDETMTVESSNPCRRITNLIG